MTVLWDGSWYRTAALHGYPTTLPLDPASGHVAQNAWAFYPLFPLLSRALMDLTGLAFPVVASTLALLCGLGASMLMAQLLAERVGERVALATVAVWAAFPAAVSLQLAYTESIAMLVLCGVLWAVMRRAWLTAAALVLLLGITRPIAAPVAVVIAVALLVRWRGRRTHPISGGEYVRGALALAASGLAAVIWPLVAWARHGLAHRLHRHHVGLACGRPHRPVHAVAVHVDVGLPRLLQRGRPGSDRPRSARGDAGRAAARALGHDGWDPSCERGAWPTRHTSPWSWTRSRASSAMRSRSSPSSPSCSVAGGPGARHAGSGPAPPCSLP